LEPRDLMTARAARSQKPRTYALADFREGRKGTHALPIRPARIAWSERCLHVKENESYERSTLNIVRARLALRPGNARRIQPAGADEQQIRRGLLQEIRPR